MTAARDHGGDATDGDASSGTLGDAARGIALGAALAGAVASAPFAPVPDQLQPVDPVERSAYELMSGLNEGFGELGQVLESSELGDPVPEPEAADHSDPPEGSLWDSPGVTDADLADADAYADSDADAYADDDAYADSDQDDAYADADAGDLGDVGADQGDAGESGDAGMGSGW